MTPNEPLFYALILLLIFCAVTAWIVRDAWRSGDGRE